MSKQKDLTVFPKRTGRVHFGKKGSFGSVTGQGFRISAVVNGNPYDKKDSVDIIWSKDASKFSADLKAAGAFVKRRSSTCSFITEQL